MSANEKASDKGPAVLAAVKPYEYNDFLKPNVKGKDLGFDLEIFDEKGIAALVEKLKADKTEVLISCWSTSSLPEDLLEQVPSLKYLSHLCGTVRSKVPRVLIEKGLIVTGWGDSIARTVAECSLLQILGCLRRVTNFQLKMHNDRGWNDPSFDDPQSLFARTVGLHGFGVIARELVKLLEPFGCEISTYSPSVPDDYLAKYGVSRAEKLEDLFSKNHIIVELAPLKPANVGLVDEKLLRMIPQGGVFVNTGRGQVVDEQALARVAADGKIHISLDVYAKEPLPTDSPLRGLPNVMLLPHIGGPTSDRRCDCGLHAIQNVQAYLAGKDLQGQVGLGQYDRQT